MEIILKDVMQKFFYISFDVKNVYNMQQIE